MTKYKVYLSSGEILEQEAPSSGYLYKCVRYRMWIEPTEFQAAVCVRMGKIGMYDERPVWVMTHDPFDGLRVSKWQEDKAHRLIARQMFLFNNGDKFWSKEWIDQLFDVPVAGHPLFVLEEV